MGIILIQALQCYIWEEEKSSLQLETPRVSETHSSKTQKPKYHCIRGKSSSGHGHLHCVKSPSGPNEQPGRDDNLSMTWYWCPIHSYFASLWQNTCHMQVKADLFWVTVLEVLVQSHLAPLFMGHGERNHTAGSMGWGETAHLMTDRKQRDERNQKEEASLNATFHWPTSSRHIPHLESPSHNDAIRS